MAHPYWTSLLLNYSTRGIVAVLFVRLDETGDLRRHAPLGHPIWPLQGRLAIVNLPAQAYFERAARNVVDEGYLVTDRLLQEMAELCRQHGIRFGIVFLEARDLLKVRYAHALAATGATVIDCAAAFTPERRIVDDGHPNEEAHAEYARCIAAALADEPS